MLPMFYKIAASRVTTAPRAEVCGDKTSGEVEFVLLQLDGKLWVGVGSDHTDRAMEARDAGLSKQLCDKPISSDFWCFDDVEPHWDQMRLRSYVTDDAGHRALYQEGSVAAMLPPRDLLRRWSALDGVPGPKLLFCGTLSSIGGIRHAARFDCELEDPVIARVMTLRYDVTVLPSHLTAPPA